MYQNVADDAISAGESANFIISQMKAFGLEAEDATHIIDALNEVSNTQAVSSADLANNLGKASAAMALGNNTYEQSLAMMTAITEINRSGAKSARALVSVQSRLTQVLDEQSSTGKALVEIYDGLGIALKDQNGQLRPTFEIFKDLAKVWPNLTTNQRDYIALTQAGANQTSNFVALMDNFDAALKAEATAMESSGSAARENAAYMESLEAQTTQLKATFQDFANNVIDKELVSSVLTLSNDALGLLNTETGKTITQWGLLTGVLTGGLTIFGQIGAKLIVGGKGILQLGKHLGVLASAFTGASVSATAFAASAAPVAAVIAAIAVAVGLAIKHYKDISQPLSEYTSQIESNNEQLKKNQERLAEIEQMSWTDKTPEILDEYDALVEQNEELQRNIDLLEKRRSNRAKDQARKGGKVATGGVYYTAVGFDDFTQYKDAETAYLTLAAAHSLVVESAEDAKQKLEAMGITLQENAEMVKVDADAYNEDLTASMQEYAGQLNSTHSLNQDQLRDYESLKVTVSERVEGLKLLEAQGDTLTESERNLIDVYDSLIETESQAKEWTEKYGDALVITDEQAQQLIKTFPVLKDNLQQTNEGWVVLETTVGEAAGALISADGRIKKSSKDRVASTLADIKAEVEAYKKLYTITLYQPYSNTDPDYEEKKRKIGMAKKGYEEAAAALVRLEWAQTQTKKYGYYDDMSPIPNSPATTKTTAKKATDLALEEFKGLQKDLEHQKELGLIKEEEYYNKLEQLIKDYKAKATAHMKEYGTDVDTINRNMYQYEEEIYKGRAKLAEDLAEKQKKAAEEAAKAQKEALEKQKEDFETAVNYVIKQIDEEIGKLQDLRDQTEQYYDDKIDAVNKANDALEDQIQYEELLNNLAKAKDKQLYVFQNGQFQYVQDVEAIASAQAELDAYERDKALQDEVKNLETLKEQALASIDEQIEGWENYKEQWSNVVNQYQDEQDRLIAEQVLGIDLEQENWNTRLANLSNFVSQYNSILSQLSSADSGSSSTSGSSSGGGLSFHQQVAQDKDILESGGSLTFTDANGNIGHITLKEHALGTTNAPGGLSLVGERGPELRVLNSGDGIIPADATRNLWDWASYSPKDFMSNMGSDNIFHIGNIALPNVTDAKSFVNGLKQLAYQRAYKRA